MTQSGSFAGAIALGRLASCGLRKNGALSPRGATELTEFVAPSLGFTDGAGTPTGLAKSPPSGATLTPFPPGSQAADWLRRSALPPGVA